mmetsp:Transcript_1735/g.4187  ORF Transcript_1735/g.4187 Transcript_1735/m.4187 type:complete len:124 (-) Transcript_1735:80-451(-)
MPLHDYEESRYDTKREKGRKESKYLAPHLWISCFCTQLVKPEKASSVENKIVAMAMQGRLPAGPGGRPQVTEGKLIEMLENQLVSNTSTTSSKNNNSAGEIRIQRKRYAFDSDDEDDNDDDLL